jgi:hypothetical protein
MYKIELCMDMHVICIEDDVIVSYNELPRDEELPFVDFDRALEFFFEWWFCPVLPPRRRETSDKCKSLDEGNLSQSHCKHCSIVGRSDERIDRHCSINRVHSMKKKKKVESEMIKSVSLERCVSKENFLDDHHMSFPCVLWRDETTILLQLIPLSHCSQWRSRLGWFSFFDEYLT